MTYLVVTSLARVCWNDALKSAIFFHVKHLLFIKMISVCTTTSKHQHHRTLLQTCNKSLTFTVFFKTTKNNHDLLDFILLIVYPGVDLGVPVFFMSWKRCCQKLRKGAMPLPAPIKIVGVVGSDGRWNPLDLKS